MLLWILISLVSATDLAEDEGVLSLTDTTFPLAELRYQSLFVHFHAPICSICRNVTSDMRRIADLVKAEFPALRMAEIDITTERATGRRFEIVGVPTIVLIEKERKLVYHGELTPKGMERWVLGAMRTGLNMVNTSEELTRFINSANFSVVLFADENSPVIPVLKTISLNPRMPPIVHCPSPDAYPPYSSSFPLLVLFNSIDDMKFPFTGPWDYWGMSQFISRRFTRISMRWDDSASEYVFARANPALFYFRTEGSAVSHERTVVGLSRLGRMPVISTDLNSQYSAGLGELLGVERLRMPAAMIVKVVGHQVQKHEFKDSLMTLSVLTSFLDSYDSGSLPFFWKSDTSIRSPDRLTVFALDVISIRFREILRKPGQSVVLWLYTPGCAGCNETLFGEVAQAFRTQPEVVFLKVNGAKNELEEFRGTQYPEMMVFPAISKRQFVYSEKYEKDEMISFVKLVLSSDSQERNKG